MFENLKSRLKKIFSKKRRESILRENMKRNFLAKDGDEAVGNSFIDAKMQSMKDSQGQSNFSGSAYNGPGSVDRDKIIYHQDRGDFSR